MTPEEIQQMKNDILELKAWKAEREHIQITAPLDDISRQNIRAITSGGLGSKAFTSTISGTPATVAKIPTGTFIMDTPDGPFEVPFY